MNQQQIYQQQILEAYLQQLQQLQNNQNQNNQNQNSKSSLDKLKGYTSKADSLGKGMQSAGDYLSGLDNGAAQKLGSGMSDIGTKLSNGAASANNFLNAPSSYFKGFANNALSSAATDSILSDAGINAAADIAGAAAGTLGAEAAGTAATAGAEAAGSALSGAAGPIGAMALQGSNQKRAVNQKRAKQAGELLMNATEQMSKQGVQQQQNNLQQAMQNIQQSGNQQYGLNSSIGEYGLNNNNNNSYSGITGGAASVSNNQGIVINFTKQLTFK